MENTITISVQDDFLENRAHGDTAFPCAAYFTDAKTHDIAGTGTKNMKFPLYEAALVRCLLERIIWYFMQEMVYLSTPERCIPRKPPRPPVIFIKKISFFTDV